MDMTRYSVMNVRRGSNAMCFQLPTFTVIMKVNKISFLVVAQLVSLILFTMLYGEIVAL